MADRGGAPARVAFLGPAGTHTEEALRASCDEPIVERPCVDVEDALREVLERHADAAVVPIENSLEGSIAATLDTLAAAAGEIEIVAEVDHPIRHCLIARDGTELEGVARVLSHPQALGQCQGFLREQLPHAERAASPSTAEAVRSVAAAAEPWAAVGSALAAEQYGCRLLAEGIEDEPGNLTRFVWIAPASAGRGPWPGGAAAKTSIVFWGFNDESPGALVAVLSELADRGVNLTKIESRPRRVKLGHYMFFADLDGPLDSEAIAAALAGLSRRVETLRVLGSYPTRSSAASQPGENAEGAG